MKYILLIAFSFVGSLVLCQEDFSEIFKEKYLSLSIEKGEELSMEKLEKWIEKDKLDKDLVLNIYAQSFDYNDVAKNTRTLMIAYLLWEEEENGFRYYTKKENFLLKSSSELYIKHWNNFVSDKEVDDSLIEVFITKELERLKNEGINIELIQGAL